MYRMKRMLMLVVTGLVLSLSTFTAGASAQTGGSFYEPFNNYNTGLWQKADGYSNGNMFNCTWRANNVSMTSAGEMRLSLTSPPITSLTAEKTAPFKRTAMGYMKST